MPTKFIWCMHRRFKKANLHAVHHILDSEANYNHLNKILHSDFSNFQCNLSNSWCNVWYGAPERKNGEVLIWIHAENNQDVPQKLCSIFCIWICYRCDLLHSILCGAWNWWCRWLAALNITSHSLMDSNKLSFSLYHRTFKQSRNQVIHTMEMTVRIETDW